MKTLEQSDIFKTIYDQSYNSIVITDAQIELPGPKFIYVNDAFTKMTGYTFEDIKDKTPRILQGEKTDMEVIKHLKECLINNEFFSGSTINYTKDGKEYHVEWNISPIKDKDGKTIYFVSVQKDITKQKLLEEKLKQEQKDKDIALKKVAMQEILERITHHWRQHLSKISASASSVQLHYELYKSLDNDIDQVIESIDDIVNETKNLSNLIEHFRQFNNNEISYMEFINIKAFVEDILKLYLLDISTVCIDVELNIDRQLKFYANKQQLSEVLLPLIDNSIYFLKQKLQEDKKIKILVITKDDGLTITIEDNAGGIEKEFLDKVFEPYFSTKIKKNYTGLGLYFVKKTIEETFSGEVNIFNTQNGLNVTVYLPKQ